MLTSGHSRGLQAAVVQQDVLGAVLPYEGAHRREGHVQGQGLVVAQQLETLLERGLGLGSGLGLVLGFGVGFRLGLWLGLGLGLALALGLVLGPHLLESSGVVDVG